MENEIKVPVAGLNIDDVLLGGYMKSLVNSFFKILPIRESIDAGYDEQSNGTIGRASSSDKFESESTFDSLGVYLKSLQAELIGCRELTLALHNDSRLVTLISILQYLIDNPQTSVGVVRREVFKAISICNALKAKYEVSVGE